MPATDERLREFARTHLADYGHADAVNAPIDVAGCTDLPVPDDLLVPAARRHLEMVDAGD